jgi:hypothetical protein
MNGSLIKKVAIAEVAAMNEAILMRSFIEHLFFNVQKNLNSYKIRIYTYFGMKKLSLLESIISIHSGDAQF